MNTKMNTNLFIMDDFCLAWFVRSRIAANNPSEALRNAPSASSTSGKLGFRDTSVAWIVLAAGRDSRQGLRPLFFYFFLILESRKKRKERK